MKKILAMVLLVGVIGSVTGCVGSNAVTGKLMGFNLKVVDNRYARGGINMLLAPVYGVTVLADAIVFNSIEFWAGKNPLNGKPHIFDSDVKTIYEINDDLAPSLNKAPLKPLGKMDHGEKEVYSIKMAPVDEDTLEFHIKYTNGDKVVLRGEKDGDIVTFYLDDNIVTTTTMADLKQCMTTPSA